MSDIIYGLIIGIVQGLTEFLPVSSSGHIELAKYILGLDKTGDDNLTLTVVVHIATALATVFVFRKDILVIISGLFSKTDNSSRLFSLKIIVSMIPAAIVGLVFEEQLDQFFSGRIGLVSALLILTAALLLLADRVKHTDKDVGWKEAFIVGVAQAIAILPGISRSGATISTSVLLNIDRSKAARFSFLMVVPLILGKVAKDLLSGEVYFESSASIMLFTAFVTAFIVGILACRWMIILVQKSKLVIFSIYCTIVGIIGLLHVIF